MIFLFKFEYFLFSQNKKPTIRAKFVHFLQLDDDHRIQFWIEGSKLNFCDCSRCELDFSKKKRYPYCEIDNRAIKARPKNSLRARRINRESPCLIGKENDKGKAELSFRLLRGTDPHRNITPLVFPVLSRSAMTTRHRIRQETATCLTSSHGHGLMDRPAEGRKGILKRKQASACTDRKSVV